MMKKIFLFVVVVVGLEKEFHIVFLYLFKK